MPGHGSAFLPSSLIKSIRKTWFSRGRGPEERLRRDKPAGDEPHPAEDIACAVSSDGAGLAGESSHSSGAGGWSFIKVLIKKV